MCSSSDAAGHSAAAAEIPFIRPSFPGAEDISGDLAEIVAAGWYTNFGPREQQFRAALAEYLGQGLHVATVANGTLALMAAVQSVFGPSAGGRYLLMPSFTFAAVAQSALWCGYRPQFVDIDGDTLQASVPAARAVLESDRDRIAGILLPNAFGVGNPRILEWEALATEWGLRLVIDSAAGFGSRYPGGELLGGHGACEVFSFHATKPFAVGEGGAVVSADRTLVERDVREFQNFGFGESRASTRLGLNAKLQEINAAIGLRQLPGFELRLAGRRATFERYRTALAPLGVDFQPGAERSSLCFAAAWLPSAADRIAVTQNLSRHRIQSRGYYNPPLHRHPHFQDGGVPAAALPVTEDVCERIVSLPVHDAMAAGDVDRVIAAVAEAIAH